MVTSIPFRGGGVFHGRLSFVLLFLLFLPGVQADISQLHLELSEASWISYRQIVKGLLILMVTNFQVPPKDLLLLQLISR